MKKQGNHTEDLNVNTFISTVSFILLVLGLTIYILTVTTGPMGKMKTKNLKFDSTSTHHLKVTLFVLDLDLIVDMWFCFYRRLWWLEKTWPFTDSAPPTPAIYSALSTQPEGAPSMCSFIHILLKSEYCVHVSNQLDFILWFHILSHIFHVIFVIWTYWLIDYDLRLIGGITALEHTIRKLYILLVKSIISPHSLKCKQLHIFLCNFNSVHKKRRQNQVLIIIIISVINLVKYFTLTTILRLVY